MSFIKRHRVLACVAAAVLAAAIALPIVLLSSNPTRAGILADNPITDLPGELDMDVSSLNWTTQNFQQFNDYAWSGINQTRSGTWEYNPVGSPVVNGTSAYFNKFTTVNPTSGVPTPVPTLDHILFYPPDDTAVPPRVAKVGFYGYSQAHFFDYVYTEDYNIYSIDFDVNPTQWNFHCLKRNGFMIKCEQDDKGTPDPNDDTISGYVLSMGGANAFLGEDTSNVDTPNTNIYLYYVENMAAAKYQQAVAYSCTPANWTFNASNSTWASRTQAQWNAIGVPATANGAANAAAIWGRFADATTTSTSAAPGAGTGLPRGSAAPALITKLAATPQFGAGTPQMHFHFEMVKDPVTGNYTDTFEIYYTPNSAGMTEQQLITNRVKLYEVDLTAVPGRVTNGRGFGLYMQSRYHSCMRLTATEFSNFGLKVENEDPTPVHAQVNYKIFGTNTPLDTPDTQTSVLGSSYTVDPLTYCRTIVSGGKTYYYFKADRVLYEPDGVTPLEFLYEEDDPGSPGVAPPDNTVDLFYIEEPTIQKNANILRNDGSGGYTADPGNPHNGTPQSPFEIEYNDRIEYEITISNPNLTALTGVPMQIVDTVPYGMKYVSSNPSVITPIGLNGRGQEVLKWNIPSIPAAVGSTPGTVTFRVVVEVEKYGLVYVNGADLSAPDTGLNVTSNRVYHISTLAPLDAQKDARIKDPVTGLYPGSPSNGTPSSRVDLGRDDTLKYTIDVTNPNPPYKGPSYDIIYNLDWSSSMEGSPNYRLLAKDVALKFSQKVFDNYPDSRVALMGTNAQASHSLSGQKQYFFLEVESDFYASWQYSPAFDSIYPTTFEHDGDDMPLGLQASIEKLDGDDSNVYGGAPVDGPFPAVGVRQINYPRLDMSRIPVIIQLSDWELDVPNGTGGNYDPNYGNSPTHSDPTLRPAWTRMRNQLTDFKTRFSDGVFIGVSFPGGNNASNRGELNSAIEDIEPTPNKWGTVPALSTHSADDLATLLWNEFTVKAPLYPNGCTVTDTLPPGLVTSVGNVSVSPPAAAAEVDDIRVTVDSNGQYVVEVEFGTFPEGTFSIDIICTVASGELTEYELDNQATITYEHGGNTYDDETNTTYHKIPTYNVTTRWAEYSSPVAAFLPGHADRVDPIIRGNTYYLDNDPTTGDMIDILYTKPSDILRTFKYYGYATSTDGGTTYSAVTTGPPPGAGFTVNSDLIIVLYFRTTYQIIEQFHDNASPYMDIFPDGSPITVYSGDSWDPASHATTIPPLRWIAGYPYTYDTLADLYKKELDTNPIKTPRSVGYVNIQEDHIVIYPYEKGQRTDFVVTETFRKITDPTQRVNAVTNPDIPTSVPGGDDFDLASGIPPKDIGSYTYVGYQIDGGSIVYGMPPAPPAHFLEYVTANHDITYLYAELATKTAQVYHGGTGTPDPEDTGTLMVPVIALPGDDILYIVKLTIPAGLAQTGSVTVTDELPKGLSTNNGNVSHGGVVSYNATTERYTVTWTLTFPTTPPPSGTLDLTARAAVVTRATYVNEADVTLNNQAYIDPYTTNYTVHDHVLPGPKTLHIRQIILARTPGTEYTELPPVGFFTAANNGTSTSLLSTSGLWSYGVTPFTIYTFPASVDMEYVIDNLVPQGYEWKDYELTRDPLVAHDRTHLTVGRPALLDYLDEREYWLTVYLTPRPRSGAYSWGFKTNDVGTIFKFN